MERIYIQRVLNYIEEHLKEELDNTMLAQIAGYSEYHFLRIFRKNIGLTPADYIRKRRISEIVCRIGEERPISDIAFEYGFNSKENFTRAFKKEHKILPTEYKTANCSLRLFQPFDFYKAEPTPQVSIGYLNPFSVVAYPCDEKLPASFWNKYNAEKRSARLSGGEITEDFGVMIFNKEKNALDYYIGIRAEKAKGDVFGTVRLDIEGGLYAIFDTPEAEQHDFVETIWRTWDWIYGVWLPDSGYRRGKGFEMESYVESSRKYSERIYVPIEAKEKKMAEIIKTFKENVPAMRFIGKKYPDFGGWWGDWFANGWFDQIEGTMNGVDSILKIWENGGGYVGLERRAENSPFEYWIGMFTPADTPVPEGFDSVDFPALGLGTCWIYGSESDVHDTSRCMEAVKKEGFEIWKDAGGGVWSFENCLCPRYTAPDEHGNIIMDYCYYVK